MKKNGFTLIELIATIGLLGMLATITITISVRKINETKESARDTMFESIELAAEKYVNDNEEELTQFKNNDNIYISLQTLVEKEYFTESLVDPTTKKSLPLSNEIYVTREENGKIKAKYNINQRTEPKLTLIGSYNEYVKLGDNYNELGVIATSKEGNDVSNNVTTTGSVDITTPNTYKVTYQLDNVKIIRNVIVYDGNLSTKEFYKLKVDLDGGIDNKDYQAKYVSGTIVELEEPTKEGYIFNGWIVNGKGSSVEGNTLTIGRNETVVKAQWELKRNFSTDSWDTIVEAVQQAYNNGTPYPYNVGDEKTIDLGTTLGTHTIRVANKTKCNDLQLQPVSKSACGFVLEFADIITTHTMNGIDTSTSTSAGGWPASEMYDYLNDEEDEESIYNLLPDELREGIIDTYVISSHGYEDITGYENVINNNFYSTDKLYLLSTSELWGSDTGGYDTAATNTITRQLDYYANYEGVTSEGENYKGVSTTNYEGAIKSQETQIFWWLRSARSDFSNYFYCVTYLGSLSFYNSYNSIGVSPAFRLAE